MLPAPRMGPLAAVADSRTPIGGPFPSSAQINSNGLPASNLFQQHLPSVQRILVSLLARFIFARLLFRSIAAAI